MSSGFSRRLASVALLFALPILSSCGGDSGGTEPPPEPVVVSVDVTPMTAEIQVGATQTFTAVGIESDGGNVSGASWTSSNTAVATVSSSGVATGVSAGTTTIRAVIDGVAGNATLTVVPVPVAAVVVSPESVEIPSGSTTQLEAAVQDASQNSLSGREVAWSSSDEAVATVDANGLVTAVAVGSVTISATSEGVSGTAQVTVRIALAADLVPHEVALTTNQVEAGDSIRFSNLAVKNLGDLPAESGYEVRLYLSNDGSLSGDDVGLSPFPTTTNAFRHPAGVVESNFFRRTEVRFGTAPGSYFLIVVVDANDNVAESDETNNQVVLPITVVAPSVASVSVTPSTGSAETGGTVQFTANVVDRYDNALTDRTVTWTSSDANIATVSATGLVTAVAAGSATITATSDGVSGTATMTVTSAVGSVDVQPFGGSFAIGNSLSLSGVLRDPQGALVTGDVVWSSGDETVATVDQNGLVTGAGVGSTLITATGGGQSTSVNVSITNPGDFSITLVYITDVEAQDRAVYDAAAAQWSAAITGDLEDFASDPGEGCEAPAVGTGIDDLTIFVTVAPIDGPFGTLGFAGPCYTRIGGASDGFPLTGTMTFDTDDIVMLRNEGSLQGTIVHEMGHILGIGTLWSEFGVAVINDTVCLQDPIFTGTAAIAAFDAAGGAARTSKVPIENGGTINDGSNCGHWRESTMDNELMTPSLNDGVNPLSAITIASLQDMGYVVNVSTAESYTIPNPLGVSPVSGQEKRFDLTGDIRYPMWGVRADGTRVRLRQDPTRR